MLITNNVPANQLATADGFLCSGFFGLATSPGTGVKQVVVHPPPVTVKTTPPSQVVEGVTVNFPPFETTVQPPDITIDVPISAPTLSNQFQSVGLVMDVVPRLVCLVRPNVVAGARHYNPPMFSRGYVGKTVRFFAGDGTIEQAIITKVAANRGDLEFYYLDHNIGVVKPASLSNIGPSLAGVALTTFGLVGPRSNPGALTAQAGRSLAKYAFANQDGTITATMGNKVGSPSVMEAGDSGSPSFFITTTGQALFIGTTSTIDLSQWQLNVVGKAEVDVISSL